MPLSRTVHQTSPFFAPALTLICPPSLVYLTALETMLMSTCSTRWRSPRMRGMFGSSSSTKLCPCACASMAMAL